ncbi:MULTISPECIES: type II toxin-antitoxin system antitoxin SocA domain-containing protein [Pedobacter]|uniref:Uncharacterized protein n=1 Tax=Pedobacter suwonensis TaxID=332999 RepID=A0A1I0TTJ0_9SPHI|nr:MULTISPECIES: type II toxin-antitoxin system antitoxin SocA domain-containing protein [Pedobacter]SFA55151.1 Protein of unknown function [Pedobacter suwonensis]
MNKIPAFDYVVHQLQNWYLENGGNMENNDLSKLKITKLLFFTCAASASSDQAGLLSHFDNFYALPYGHVESDIQDKMDMSVFFNISKTQLTYKTAGRMYEAENLSLEIKEIIDHAIEKLKNINYNLIKLTAFELVDLSHMWQSWKSVFSLAQQNGRYSMKIPVEMIMAEPKIFKL